MRIKKIITLTRKLDIEPTRTFHLTTQEKELKTAIRKKTNFNFPFKVEGIFFQISLRCSPRCVSAKHMAESLSRQVGW